MNENDTDWGALLRQISTSSAVNPTMVVLISCLLIGGLGLQFGGEHARLFYMAIMGTPMIVFVLQVCYFSIVDPDRLQNERHIEKKMIIARSIKYKEQGLLAEIPLRSDEAIIQNPNLGSDSE